MKYIFLTFFLFTAFTSAAPNKCVQIYYDQNPEQDPLRSYGHFNAIFIRNLIGHFPEYKVSLQAVESYVKGNIEKCKVSFYIGTTANNPLPADFLSDVLTTQKTFAWIGYNLQQFTQSEIESQWNLTFNGVRGLDLNLPDAQGEPGFFRHFTYKGETFWKLGRWASPEKNHYIASADLISTQPKDSQEVKSWAWHSVSNERQPYVVQHANKWFIADIPFQYLHEEDRYLIFTDILFDILESKPKYKGKRPALIRFEDMHAALPQWQLDRVLEITQNNKIAFTLSLIPQFEDPFMTIVHDPALKKIALDESPRMLKFLQAAAKQGGSFLQHGTTHQYETMKNPNKSISGEDCEFWNCLDHTAITEVSSLGWVQRLERGYAIMERANAKPVAWLTPHYAASALVNVILGQVYLWSVGRVNYQPLEIVQEQRLPDLLSLDISGIGASDLRIPFFDKLKIVSAPERLAQGQFFPYEIESDYYGQRIYPENAGFPGSLKSSAPNGRSVDDMIRIFKRNKVIRDSWASFFVHPFLLGQSGGEEDANLEKLIKEIKALGYEFKNLSNN